MAWSVGSFLWSDTTAARGIMRSKVEREIKDSTCATPDQGQRLPAPFSLIVAWVLALHTL